MLAVLWASCSVCDLMTSGGLEVFFAVKEVQNMLLSVFVILTVKL